MSGYSVTSTCPHCGETVVSENAAARCSCGKTEIMVGAAPWKPPTLRVIQGDAEESPKPPIGAGSSEPS